MNTKFPIAAAALALLLSLVPEMSSAQDALVTGEVKKIDEPAG